MRMRMPKVQYFICIKFKNKVIVALFFNLFLKIQNYLKFNTFRYIYIILQVLKIDLQINYFSKYNYSYIKLNLKLFINFNLVNF